MAGKKVPVITPKLCGGYKIPTGNKDSSALYHPALNQVWIFGSTTKNELALIHAHESMHMYTTSLQPSQLLFLRAELLGYVDRPGKDCFDGIVETVCEACFWAETKLGIEDIPFMIRDAKYPDIFSALIELSQNIASNDPESSANEKTLKEAVNAICILLMHIVPHRPGIELELINIIAGLPLPRDCKNKWSIFLDIYVKLDAKWKKTEELKKLFSLILPKDSHRFVSDMVIFLLGALKVVHTRPEIITAVFPVLLLLLTQASFVILPFIYIRESAGKYEAEIKLVHSTSKSNEGSSAASMQQEAFMKSKEKGILCGAAPFFVPLLNESNKYMISDTKDRTYKCFGQLLEILPDLIKAHLLTKNNCPGCRTFFQGDIFESAVEAIINIPESTKQKMIQSVKGYDKFLATDAMDIIQDAQKLNSTPKAVRSYDFL